MDHPILEGLRRDHKNIGRVLGVAIHELDEIANGGDADYALLEDALRYITGYSDVHHHPVEDRVYAELRKTSPQAAQKVDQIVSQHETLIRQGQAFLEKIEAVEEAAIVRLDALVQTGRDYLSSLGRHMGLEESGLFPLAAENLTSDSWALIETSFEQAPDPLFGPAATREFENLLRRIHS